MGAAADRRYLWMALVLLAAFMVGRWPSPRSRALLTGTALRRRPHALRCRRAGRRTMGDAPGRATRQGAGTFGWKGPTSFSAAGNGITLLVVSALIGSRRSAASSPRRTYLAARSWSSPSSESPSTSPPPGSCKGNRSNLNMRAAFAHILTDLYGYLGTVIAGIVIHHRLHALRLIASLLVSDSC